MAATAGGRVTPKETMGRDEPGPLGRIGLVIKLLRTRAGWTQGQLADAAGLTSSQISKYERGREMPTLKNVDKILVALGVRSPLQLAAALEDAGRSEEWARAAAGGEGPTCQASPVSRARREEALQGLRDSFESFLQVVEETIHQGPS